jgi:hypothetical protein
MYKRLLFSALLTAGAIAIGVPPPAQCQGPSCENKCAAEYNQCVANGANSGNGCNGHLQACLNRCR